VPISKKRTAYLIISLVMLVNAAVFSVIAIAGENSANIAIAIACVMVACVLAILGFSDRSNQNMLRK